MPPNLERLHLLRDSPTLWVQEWRSSFLSEAVLLKRGERVMTISRRGDASLICYGPCLHLRITPAARQRASSSDATEEWGWAWHREEGMMFSLQEGLSASAKCFARRPQFPSPVRTALRRGAHVGSGSPHHCWGGRCSLPLRQISTLSCKTGNNRVYLTGLLEILHAHAQGANSSNPQKGFRNY